MILVAAQGTPHVAVVVALFDVVAFIEKFFALGECYFNLNQSVAEVEFCRNNGFSAGADFRNKLSDFPCVQKQFPRAIGLVIVRVAEIVFGNVRVVEYGDCTIINADKGVGDIGPSEANRLYLGPRERDSRFKAASEEIISGGFGVADFCEPRVVFFLTHGISENEKGRRFVPRSGT